jgi:cytochrome c oxidase accessory protein FixG
MCPYSRFQSAMFDKNTLIISYDEKRGEPRGKWDGNAAKTQGHCIDCKQCVVVCPTGIDIRNGLQMECIACGLCVDACDNVMEKIGLPKGLIRYDTMAHMIDPKPEKKFKILKPRSIYYATILTLVCGIMIRSLLHKPTLEVSAIPDRDPIFVRLSDGSIRNGYSIKIVNKTHERKTFALKILHPSEASAKIVNADLQNLVVDHDEAVTFKVFVTMPKDFLDQNEEGRGLVEFIITDDVEEKKVQAVFISK